VSVLPSQVSSLQRWWWCLWRTAVVWRRDHQAGLQCVHTRHHLNGFLPDRRRGQHAVVSAALRQHQRGDLVGEVEPRPPAATAASAGAAPAARRVHLLERRWCLRGGRQARASAAPNGDASGGSGAARQGEVPLQRGSVGRRTGASCSSDRRGEPQLRGSAPRRGAAPGAGGRATASETSTAVRAAAQMAGTAGGRAAVQTGAGCGADGRHGQASSAGWCPHGQASNGSSAPTGRIDEIKQASSAFSTQTHFPNTTKFCTAAELKGKTVISPNHLSPSSKI
jgi:hypothetical protein